MYCSFHNQKKYNKFLAGIQEMSASHLYCSVSKRKFPNLSSLIKLSLHKVFVIFAFQFRTRENCFNSGSIVIKFCECEYLKPVIKCEGCEFYHNLNRSTFWKKVVSTKDSSTIVVDRKGRCENILCAVDSCIAHLAGTSAVSVFCMEDWRYDLTYRKALGFVKGKFRWKAKKMRKPISFLFWKTSQGMLKNVLQSRD